MKHILMLVDNPARDDPRVMPEAISLTEAGYRVTVIGLALRPDVPMRDVIQGINIILAPMTGFSLNPFVIILGLWHFCRAETGLTSKGMPGTRMHRLTFFTYLMWVTRLAIAIRADAVHSHDVLMLPVAWLYSRLRNVPLIYDSHENAAFIRGRLRQRIYPPLEKLLIGQADVVITVGERLATALRQRGAKRVLVIGNWKNTQDFSVSVDHLVTTRETLGISSALLVVSYIGVLSRERGVETLIKAIINTPDVHLIIAGAGELEAWISQKAQAASNIHWLGWIPRTQVALYTLLSDAVYYCLESNQGNLYYSTPNKLFEAFAASKAMIARRGFGELGDILEKSNAGIFVDQVEVKTLQLAFEKLQDTTTLSKLQNAALQASEIYSWREAEQRLRNLYRELLVDRR